MIASDEQLERYRVVGRIVELVQRMSMERLTDLLNDLEKAAAAQSKLDGDRKDLRINCLISVDYSDSDRFFKDYIQDISSSGVFIKTRESFSVGEEIVLSMALSGDENAFRIPAEVMRISSEGIGVQFKIQSQVQEDIIASLVDEMNGRKA
ncbi:MAG: PilZ domain-containing protein [Deltaproteobacteria bacterium]|nr:PilZ domain-containing protein [Deltaproteobacteria bacterium]MBW2175766.1 PilZ domain-containing protein [Deltaproteobacteria bacterium]MBW2297014.1 PilZ domain-containing protein [Deltaproteobacteria bacterium]MBW2611753.1 PilZ domain-containing protein [Deltaproteobacteria bacterium]MBW2633956.1 PilZ domain-containing protein [Deltaproteobacteria bacterium]